MLMTGAAAPDFAIGATTLFQLLERGPVAVFFFPKAFTPGCTREAGGFRLSYADLKAAGCELVGVSSDRQETNDRFVESLCLPFPVVGDKSGDVLRAFGVRIPVLGLARRVTFLIGSDRRIRLAFESQFDAQAHIAKVREALGLGSPQS